jgi:hypothetical protein
MLAMGFVARFTGGHSDDMVKGEVFVGPAINAPVRASPQSIRRSINDRPRPLCGVASQFSKLLGLILSTRISGSGPKIVRNISLNENSELGKGALVPGHAATLVNVPKLPFRH